MIHHPLRSIALTVSLFAAIGTVSAQRPELNVHHVGEYAASLPLGWARVRRSRPARGKTACAT